MSWSFHKIGTPANLAAALEAESELLSGDSKIEFDRAKPLLRGLLELNRGDNAPVMRLNAAGHATWRYPQPHREAASSTCFVTLASMDGQLV